MDEYDELFEIEDNFDDQFADELEALADLERGEEQQTVDKQSVRVVCSGNLFYFYIFDENKYLFTTLSFSFP